MPCKDNAFKQELHSCPATCKRALQRARAANLDGFARDHRRSIEIDQGDITGRAGDDEVVRTDVLVHDLRIVDLRDGLGHLDGQAQEFLERKLQLRNMFCETGPVGVRKESPTLAP